jgi:hypothetical protein
MPLQPIEHFLRNGGKLGGVGVGVGVGNGYEE